MRSAAWRWTSLCSLGPAPARGGEDGGDCEEEQGHGRGWEEGVALQSIAQNACGQRTTGGGEGEEGELEAHQAAVERSAEVVAHDQGTHRKDCAKRDPEEPHVQVEPQTFYRAG